MSSTKADISRIQFLYERISKFSVEETSASPYFGKLAFSNLDFSSGFSELKKYLGGTLHMKGQGCVARLFLTPKRDHIKNIFKMYFYVSV